MLRSIRASTTTGLAALYPGAQRALVCLVSLPLSLAVLGCDGEGGSGGSSGSAGAAAAGSSGSSGGSGSAPAGGSGGSGGAASTGGGGTGGSPLPKALFHRVGRFDESDPAKPTASWSGSTFRTRLSGTSLSVSLGGAAGVIFQVEIDGQPTGKLETSGGDKVYEVAKDLAEGEHDVVLVRRNEGYYGGVAFKAFEPGAGASLVETAWPYAHTMELIGDSLTAGYGIEGADASCNFSAGTESYYGTYGAVAGRNLNVAVHAIAFSGKGVFQNYQGDKNEVMPELWHRTLTNDPSSVWDFAKFVPEAVVVNLGTNDFSAPVTHDEFVGAYFSLLTEVRSKYPAAMVFCVSWAHWGQQHESWVEDAMTMTGDARMRHLGFSIDPKDGLGCDSHTNLVTNAKLGAVLTQALKDELGW